MHSYESSGFGSQAALSERDRNETSLHSLLHFVDAEVALRTNHHHTVMSCLQHILQLQLSLKVFLLVAMANIFITMERLADKILERSHGVELWPVRLAALLHRKISLLRILLAALTLQLIFSPGQIATPGFQLSYLAVAGIAILYPWLEGLYPKADNDRFNIPRKIWQLCSLSISCQVFTTPVAWLQFGSLPKYFLLANLLIMPLATAFTAVSIFIVFLAPIGLCPGFLLSAADVFSNLMIQILTIIAGM